MFRARLSLALALACILPLGCTLAVPPALTTALTNSSTAASNSPTPVASAMATTAPSASSSAVASTGATFAVDPLGNAATHVLEWTDSSPATGVALTMTKTYTENAAGPPTQHITLAYTPAAGSVSFSLKAPPGSAGTTITAYDLVYTYNTANRQTQGLPQQQLGPTRVTIDPLVIPAGTATAYGPAAQLTVPLGSATLEPLFTLDDPADAPGIIIATLDFIGSDGLAVQDKTFKSLEIATPIRLL